MNFFKKLLNRQSFEDKEVKSQEVTLSLDDLFVHKFISKGGKFLYCTNKQEVLENFKKIISENNWKNLQLLDDKLHTFLNKDITISKTKLSLPVFSSCEHLIANNGNILFSSNQLSSTKIAEFSDNFIVYATTSQIVKDIGEGLTGIKTRYKNQLPTNISAVKNYNLTKEDDNFLNYGNSNSKNLYLLLFEDL